MRYHLIPVRVAITKKRRDNKCCEGVEKRGFLCIGIGGNVNCYSHYGQQYGVSYKNQKLK